MKILLILNEPAYGNERSYNALRLGGSLAKKQEQVKIFFTGMRLRVRKEINVFLLAITTLKICYQV